MAMGASVYSSDDFLSYWSFNSAITAEGEASNDGVTSAEPNWVNGTAGKALNVGGANRYLKLSNYTKKLEGAPAISVTGSFKNYDMPPGDPKQYIIFKIIINGSNGGFNVYIENNMLVFEARSAPDDKMQSVKTAFTDVGNWHSFSAVADYANKKMTLYIDGKEAVTGKPAFSSDKFVIGTPINPDLTIGGAGSNMLNGAVDEFKIFKNALEATDISAIAEEGSTDTLVNPYIIGGWSFNEGTGADIRGKGIEFDVANYITENGKIGKGLAFKGSDKNLRIGTSIAKSLNKQQSISISMWFKNDSMPQDNVYSLFKTYNGARAGFEVQITPQGLAVMAKSTVYDAGANEIFPYNDKVNWHHLTAEANFKAKTIRLFLDGKLLGTRNVEFKSPVYKLTNINGQDSIGGFNSTTMLDGEIDELMILSKPTEPSEISSLMNTTVDEASINSIVLLEVNFKDISNHWAKESIITVTSRGIMKGINSTAFEPELNLKRYEFVELIADITGIKPTKYKNITKDISGSESFADIFQGAYNAGLIERHLLEAQEFRPQSAITLQDATVIAVKAYEYLKMNLEQKETEIIIDGTQPWANPYILLAQKTGILNFQNANGNSLLTRGQAADILSKFIKK